MPDDITEIAELLGSQLLEKKMKLFIAESCTAGSVCTTLGAAQDSSQFFSGGAVTYTEEAKINVLGVNVETLREYTAVSRETVLEMAEGAGRLMPGHVTLAISGYAGPGPGPDGTAAGTVWFAWSLADGKAFAEKRHFSGECEEVIAKAARTALETLLNLLGGSSEDRTRPSRVN